MVDEPLKRLLDAESRAEEIIAHADAERHRVIEQARHEAREAERQHDERIEELHASFLKQAEQRAQQTIAELKRRHVERSAALQNAAEQRKQQAVEAAVTLLIATEPERQ